MTTNIIGLKVKAVTEKYPKKDLGNCITALAYLNEINEIGSRPALYQAFRRVCPEIDNIRFARSVRNAKAARNYQATLESIKARVDRVLSHPVTFTDEEAA